jgi:hypothetical protein
MTKHTAKTVSVFLLTLFVACVGFAVPAYAQAVQTVVITQAGSYQLDRNVNVQGDGIEIRASFVTLDLNGFNVIATGTGIVTTAGNLNNIVVINGTVTAQESGIVLQATNSRVEQVTVRAGQRGISVAGSHAIVKRNMVSNTSLGISCSSCIVTENSVENNSNAPGSAGISASSGSLVLENRVTSSAGFALSLDNSTGYANNVLSSNEGREVSGGVQIGNNLCVTSGICQ